MAILAKIFLLVTGALWLGFGAYMFVSPQALQEMAGVAATNATGVFELRAMYGGLQFAVGVLALLAGLFAAWRRVGLTTLLFIYGGMAIARILAAVYAGEWSTYAIGAIAFDLPSALISGALLRRELRLSAPLVPRVSLEGSR